MFANNSSVQQILRVHSHTTGCDHSVLICQMSALVPHVFHMRLFSNTLSLFSYTEAREEYPLDVVDDSARRFPFFCLPFYIYPSRRQYSVPDDPHILPDVSILC